MDQEEKNKKEKSLNKENLTENKEKTTDYYGVAKLAAIRAAKKLNNSDSQWTLVQEIFQEIQAAYIIKDPDFMPPITKLSEELKAEIEKRYTEDPEVKELLLASIPAARSIREWVKKEGWDEAVWSKIRQDGLFTASKRAQVIESLRKRALDKSDVAAKIWLTLSGDYSEKMEVDNRSIDIYREINSVLHKKKE
jgi:hypothetical protein